MSTPTPPPPPIPLGKKEPVSFVGRIKAYTNDEVVINAIKAKILVDYPTLENGEARLIAPSVVIKGLGLDTTKKTVCLIIYKEEVINKLNDPAPLGVFKGRTYWGKVYNLSEPV